MGNIILMKAELALDTRRQTHIVNLMDRTFPIVGALVLEKDHSTNYPRSIPRKVGPCFTYNCHGLTFGSRRTEIQSDQIPMILEQDDYVCIAQNDVLPGDIAVYYSTGQQPGAISGDVEHSGIVLQRNEIGNILLISKWGACDERVHFVADTPYDSGDVRYYRINDSQPVNAAKTATGRK
ncbi:MAG: hypothetical protein AB7P12_09270 [Alphaproteobacteria bacterium]